MVDLTLRQNEYINRTNEERDEVFFCRLLLNRDAKTKEKREIIKEKSLSNITRRNK
jgi:hypothetical protein